jgi:hypothetical protein
MLRSFLVTVSAICSMATSCWLASRVVLTPAPSPVVRLQDRAVAITDSIATKHELQRKQPWYYCTVRGVQGEPTAAWERGPLWVTACVERTQPPRVEIEIRYNGIRWNAKSKAFRHELPNALRAGLGTDSVTVAVDPK